MFGGPQELSLVDLVVPREVHDAEEILHLVRYLHLPFLVVLHFLQSQKI